MKDALLLKLESDTARIDLPVETDSNWEVMIGSSSDELISLVHDNFMNDSQVMVKSYSNGCDLLVSAARELPDIVVLDEQIQGVTLREIIRCVGQSDCFRDMKVFCCISPDDTVLPSEWKSKQILFLNCRDRVQIARKLTTHLYLSSTHRNRRFQPEKERRWPRISLDITARIEIFNPLGNIRYDYGAAQIVNLSREGAGISKIMLKNRRIPEGAFYLRLRVNHPPLEDWKADSLVTRMDDGVSAGLKFVNISKQDRSKVMQLFE